MEMKEGKKCLKEDPVKILFLNDDNEWSRERKTITHISEVWCRCVAAAFKSRCPGSFLQSLATLSRGFLICRLPSVETTRWPFDSEAIVANFRNDLISLSFSSSSSLILFPTSLSLSPSNVHYIPTTFCRILSFSFITFVFYFLETYLCLPSPRFSLLKGHFWKVMLFQDRGSHGSPQIPFFRYLWNVLTYWGKW